MREDGRSDQSGNSRCSKWLDSTHISKVRLTGFAFLMMALGPHCNVLTSQPVCNFLVGRAHFLCFSRGLSCIVPSQQQILCLEHPWPFNTKEQQCPETHQCLANSDFRTLAIWINDQLCDKTFSGTIPNLYSLPKALQYIRFFAVILATFKYSNTVLLSTGQFLWHKLDTICSFGLKTNKQNPKEKHVIWRIHANRTKNKNTLGYWLGFL